MDEGDSKEVTTPLPSPNLCPDYRLCQGKVWDVVLGEALAMGCCWKYWAPCPNAVYIHGFWLSLD